MPWAGRLLLGAAIVSGLAGVALSHRLASGGPALEQRWSLLALLGAWWAVFALGSAALLRLPARQSLVIALVLAIAMRVVALTAIPVLSDDVYRYAWDGRVQAAGIDPYRHPPSSPSLAGLREPWLWPDAADCERLERPPGCTRINRENERTIYPPLAQVWFRAGYAVLPFDQRDRGWQVLAMAVDLGLVAVLLGALRASGRDPRWIVLYAWSPIAVLESAQSAHVDVLAVVAAVGALWAARRQRHALAGVLLGSATVVKLYPALLLPVVLRRRPLRTALAFGAVVVLAYARHVASVGIEVIGFLPGYLAEEGYAAGSRFLLVGLSGLSGFPAQAVVAAGLAVVVGMAWRSTDPPEIPARRLVGAALLLATPIQPWYALLLVAVSTLSGAWWWLFVAAAGYPLYLAALLDGPLTSVGRISYGVAALALVGCLAWRRRYGGSSTPVATTAPIRVGE